MGSKPIGKCVNIKFLILPTLWGGFYHSLRCLDFFFNSVWKEDPGVGLTSVRG